jgi:4-amino-4-deoxy-L-arabinose transferase-like glycosyltransferase
LNESLRPDSPLPAFWWTAPVLALVVFVLAFPQALQLPLLDRDEPRFAEASREMLQSGDYVVPTFNHQPRYAKPPLIYWCQVAAYQVFGENAFAARLPSLLAVAGTAVLLLAWGRALGSHAAGLIAALAYALCLQVMQQGRVATADALLIFFMTLTGLAGWRMLDLVRTGNGSWNLWGAILALGFGGGFLAKGPEALLPIIPILIMARWMGWRGLAPFAAILALGLLFVAAWAIPAFVQTHGDYWREGLGHDVGDRMVTGFQGHGASTFGWYLLGLPFYLLTFWLSALPWSPLLAMRARTLRDAAPLDWTDRYLLGNALLVFVVFSLMVTKLPHYTLPAFPFLTLLLGRRWIAAGLPSRAPLRLMIVVGLIMGILLGVIGRFCGPLGATPSPVGMLVLKAGTVLTPGTRVAMVDFREPNAVWEIRRVVHAPLDEISEDAALAYLHQPGARGIILSRAAWARMHGLDASIKIYEARGFNAARLGGLDLMLLIKPVRR